MSQPIRFFSDNAASVHPAVLSALQNANSPDSAYDSDRLTQRLNVEFSRLFDTQVDVIWVATGTAANSLALASLCKPHQGVICHEEAHIQKDEGGAPEFYTGGAKLMLSKGVGAKIDAAEIERHCLTIRNDIHQVKPAAVSITNTTEYGLVYSPEEVAAISKVCKKRGLGLHMDGARFANAVTSLNCHPGDVTWRAGVDVLSFGFIKNGGMSSEAIVFFNRHSLDDTRYRLKRGGHLQSKGRYLAAQLLAMVENDVWLNNARQSNTGAQMIAEAARHRLVYPVEGNEVFIKMSSEEAASLRAAGFDFYDWGVGQARIIVSWNQSPEEIRQLTDAIKKILINNNKNKENEMNGEVATVISAGG
eukprot:GHVN01106848.1.p2 GENE.GHVN01106848.1~~GHVN01106848.1.p2  ORF type:complete len:362 (-),score=83.41 GHVN01106848.1:1377-2462(-)